MKKGAGYIRVSTEAQTDGTSLKEQKEKIETRSKLDDVELVQIYEDAGVSGGSLDRPALQQLLNDAHSHKFDIVYFSKLDRMGRSTRDFLNILHEFTELGIDLVSTEQSFLNTSGPMGKVIVAIFAAIAEWERETISQRTRSGRMIKWKQGSLMGEIPYGYIQDKETKKIKINREAAKTYKRIVDLYLDERMIIKNICLRLTQEGVTTPSALKGKKGKRGVPATRWDASTVLRLLRSKCYTGEEIFYNKTKKDWFDGGKKGRYMSSTDIPKDQSEWVAKRFPPLITPERFNDIQNRLVQMRRIPRNEKKGYEFLLGSYVYCGICGGRIRHKASLRKGKLEKLYYRCYWRGCGDTEREIQGKQKCLLKAADATLIDKVVYDKICNILSNPKKYADSWLKNLDIVTLDEKINNLKTNLERLEKELSEGFQYIRSIQDQDLKKKYSALQKEKEKEYSETKIVLSQVESEKNSANDKTNRFKELQDLFTDKDQGGIIAKMGIKKFLNGLSFKERKALVESVIAPERGGKVFLDYTRAADIGDFELSDGNLSREQIMERDQRILYDHPMIPVLDFEIDAERIKYIIEKLDRGEALVDPLHSSVYVSKGSSKGFIRRFHLY